MYRRHRSPSMSQFPSRVAAEIGAELFVIGLLAILLMLAIVHVVLPPIAMPMVGVAAFFAMLVCGGMALAAKIEKRWLDIPTWGFVAFLAIVWIAADRLIDAEAIEHWLSP